MEQETSLEYLKEGNVHTEALDQTTDSLSPRPLHQFAWESPANHETLGLKCNGSRFYRF